MTSEAKAVKALLSELTASPLYHFPTKGLVAPREPGVYVIYDPNGNVAHVGRTPSGQGGIHQRLRNHLHGASSFTRLYLGRQGAKLRDGYAYRYLVIADPRLRALVEAYATGCLCPGHLGLG
jgi:hypothetical protein